MPKKNTGLSAEDLEEVGGTADSGRYSNKKTKGTGAKIKEKAKKVTLRSLAEKDRRASDRKKLRTSILAKRRVTGKKDVQAKSYKVRKASDVGREMNEAGEKMLKDEKKS